MSTVLRKVVTEKEIQSGRIALPAMVRDRFFPRVAENTKTPVTVEDENGDTHDIVVKVRDNGTKPEIMARGGRMLVQKRKLSPGDALVFPDGESGDRIRLKVEKKARLAPPARLGAFLIGFAQASFVQEPPPPPPLLEPVAFGFDMPIGSNDHVPPATVNLALGLGLSSIGSDGEPVELPNASVVGLSLSIGSGHAAAVRPPPVVPQLGLSSIGSDHSRLTVELSLSMGSGRHAQLEPLEALPMALTSSAGKTIKRVKLEAQELVEEGPTLELTLGLGTPPPPPSPAVLLQDQRREERAVLELSLFDKFSPKLMMEQEIKLMKPPQGALFLDPAHPEAAYSPEMQEPKPPTPAPPAEFDFLALSLSRVPLEEVIVPGAPVAKAKVQKALVDPKAAAARGSCWVDFSTPGRMLAKQTRRVLRAMGQPACRVRATSRADVL